nr:MAG TPA: Mastoparan peptide [Bacteriophage sp.]
MVITKLLVISEYIELGKMVMNIISCWKVTVLIM